MPPHALQRAGERGFGRIRPQAKIVSGDLTLGKHGGRFDNQQRRSRDSEIAKVDQVPVGGAALVRRILAHRRDDDAIAQFHSAHAKWGEEAASAHCELPCICASVSPPRPCLGVRDRPFLTKVAHRRKAPNRFAG